MGVQTEGRMLGLKLGRWTEVRCKYGASVPGLEAGPPSLVARAPSLEACAPSLEARPPSLEARPRETGGQDHAHNAEKCLSNAKCSLKPPRLWRENTTNSRSAAGSAQGPTT